MLAREYAHDANIQTKPIIMSHHMLMGLLEGQEKMSKSNPNSAVFMEDTPKEVERKIKDAACFEGVIANNPILDYTKHIIFGWRNSLLIERKP